MDELALDTIRKNVTGILQNLPPEVLLVAAAKTRLPEEVKAAIKAGIQIKKSYAGSH